MTAANTDSDMSLLIKVPHFKQDRNQKSFYVWAVFGAVITSSILQQCKLVINNVHLVLNISIPALRD